MPNIVKHKTKNHKYKGGVKSKSKKPSPKTVKSHKPSIKVKVKFNNFFPDEKSSNKKSVTPVFTTTEGEDDIEANLSVLIELMGSSLYDIYVEQVLNTKLEDNKQISVKPVLKPMSHDNIKSKDCKNPTIFYGKGSTHFTCSFDCENLWDSYIEGVQKTSTDHFCQTFALMRMESHFFPDSFVGNQFALLHDKYDGSVNEKTRYFDNAIIAKNVACHILQKLHDDDTIFKNNNDHYEDTPNEYKKIEDYVFHVLAVGQHKTKNTKITLNNSKRILNALIKYCNSLTIDDFEKSSFCEKITLEKCSRR